jgi:hypothetical protein
MWGESPTVDCLSAQSRKFGDASDAALVAQVSNLLYRGFPIRNGHDARTVSRLEVSDTAGWKPAPRQRIYAHG